MRPLGYYCIGNLILASLPLKGVDNSLPPELLTFIDKDYVLSPLLGTAAFDQQRETYKVTARSRLSFGLRQRRRPQMSLSVLDRAAHFIGEKQRVLSIKNPKQNKIMCTEKISSSRPCSDSARPVPQAAGSPSALIRYFPRLPVPPGVRAPWGCFPSGSMVFKTVRY